MKQIAIYIMASQKNGTIYTGVTSDLYKRIYEHKYSIRECFTEKYNCKLFVYYELFGSIKLAIQREKQIKGYSRKKKLALIESLNPNWDDIKIL